ncbi:glycosyltransferase [Bogoriella caseilytica]|uniref:Cellulose synthase (UDP-forming) n=1 Tax=Bogoriella caseilytica TaxID=56055 RepID=A0A3N2BDT9_9MICO|nr:glycosyltransferase [Bogoriella caseilytica]ROR73416.1 cellulose synthase (UDP-forming) [Bogoriella caseilytica]
MSRRLIVIRVLAVCSVIFGLNYVTWRWLESVNWSAWWIAVPLILAETYSLIDTMLFATTMWRSKEREKPRSAPTGTVDVLITTYNEPVALVEATARGAKNIAYPHETWILDDGNRPEMRAAAEALGVGYLTRSEDWTGKPRHAKAGNLNNALFQTDGEFLLILDADQVPDPLILHQTLGYFADDPELALVQTPQWFTNVDEADPLGSQAPLFYGPIQQGKDGWNAAFFCGSNAVLRRDALMQLGIVGYVHDLQSSALRTLRAAEGMLTRQARRHRQAPELASELRELGRDAAEGIREIRQGEPIAEVLWRVQQHAEKSAQRLLDADVAEMRQDLEELGALPIQHDAELNGVIVDDQGLQELSARDLSPLTAISSVADLLAELRVDRPGEAQPIQPMATISVTEDMATAMQLHSLGWRSAYHHEVLAHGLAPEDLSTMLKQRLRWAQGTLQVMLRDNPLVKRGLSAGQRLMYFSTMWSYLSGFAALAYLSAPVIYLTAGVLPVNAWSLDFFARFLPYFLLNQLMFVVVARGIRTWRGQQYSLALFPVWIKACVSTAANVYFRQPLGFVVTRKDGTGDGIPWREVWPQLTAIVLLIVALITGLAQWAVGTNDGTGTIVNVIWVAYSLAVLSIIIQAMRYRGPVAALPERTTT